MEGDAHYHLLGRTLRVSWDASMSRRAIETVLDYHGFRPATSPDPTVSWSLACASGVGRPAGARHIAEHETGLSIWHHGASYYIEHSEGTISIDTPSGRIEGVLPRATDKVTTELYVTLTFVVLLLLEVDGWYGMHAACLVHPHGGGVLLVGPSDSGKSTMALHLAEQGWHYLSDDSVLLRFASETVVVHPLRPDFCVDPDAETFFPVLAGAREAMLTDADKWRVRVDALFPGQRADITTPRAILFPHITGAAASHVERMRPIDALMALLPQASLLRRDPQHARAFTDVLRQLVEQAAAYRFHSGTDIHRDGARLASLLSDLPALSHAHPDAQA